MTKKKTEDRFKPIIESIKEDGSTKEYYDLIEGVFVDAENYEIHINDEDIDDEDLPDDSFPGCRVCSYKKTNLYPGLHQDFDIKILHLQYPNLEQYKRVEDGIEYDITTWTYVTGQRKCIQFHYLGERYRYNGKPWLIVWDIYGNIIKQFYNENILYTSELEKEKSKTNTDILYEQDLRKK